MYAYAALSTSMFRPLPWVHMAHGENAQDMFRWVGGPLFGYDPPNVRRGSKTHISHDSNRSSNLVDMKTVNVTDGLQHLLKCNHPKSRKDMMGDVQGKFHLIPAAVQNIRNFYYTWPKPPLRLFDAVALTTPGMLARKLIPKPMKPPSRRSPKQQIRQLRVPRIMQAPLRLNSTTFNIAVHVRRGDINRYPVMNRPEMEPGVSKAINVTTHFESTQLDNSRLVHDESYAECVKHVLRSGYKCSSRFRLIKVYREVSNTSWPRCRIHIFSDEREGSSELDHLVSLIAAHVNDMNAAMVMEHVTATEEKKRTSSIDWQDREDDETAAVGFPELHLGTTLKDSFHHMVNADALIVSKSALSWTAGLLSTGAVYAPFLGPQASERHMRPCLGRLK
jgi:hypothetical protein